MWIQRRWLTLVVLFTTWKIVCSDENELFSSFQSGQTTAHNDWYEVGRDDFTDIESDCKRNITTVVRKTDGPGTLLVSFYPAKKFAFWGVSFCEDRSLEVCYAFENHILDSSYMYGGWVRLSRNETGEKLWVPGKTERLPATFLQGYTIMRSTVEEEEKRAYHQFYIETGYDNHVRIRYNGATAAQQRTMTFKMEQTGFKVVSVSADMTGSAITVAGTKGCSIFKRMVFGKPGQDIKLYLEKPLGSIGLSLCDNSPGLEYECYVLEVVGIFENKLNYFWRRHSKDLKNGEEGWVPGLERKLNGTLPAQREKEWKDMKDSAWKEAPEGITLFVKRTVDDKLIVRYSLRRHNSYAHASASHLTLDIPCQPCIFGAAGHRAIVSGKEVNLPDVIALGPCFNGAELGFITQTCQQHVPLRDPTFPKNESFPLFSPRPGVTDGVLESNIIESKAVRKNLCVSLLGIVSSEGGIIIVTVRDHLGKHNETVFVGNLTTNRIYPPEWQRKRMSIDLPTFLQNVPLRITITSKRLRPESFVLLSEAKLCSYDGCGLPTAKGVPFVAFGKKAYPPDYPWHVAVYKTLDGKQFNYVCGGTLIRPDAVISAAHCFSRDLNDYSLDDKSKYKLAVGKVFRSLYAVDPNQQLSNALDIKVPPRYNGVTNSYVHDIAIIRVSFNISSLILPACLDWFENSVQRLRSGDIGKVSGWGLNEKAVLSSELRFAELPFIPYEQCKTAVPKTFFPFVTSDKFCAGYINGSTVKRGDSGGGLVFETGGRWFLRGVVSTGPPDELTYTTFTEVSQFMDWIKDVLNIKY